MKRSKHSLSHYVQLSCSMGELVPISCYEVLPGDSIQQASNLVMRVLPLLAPVMHPVRIQIHNWFVPSRLVWPEGEEGGWESFITGGADGFDDSVYPTISTPASTGFSVGSLADYLGVPPGVPSRPVSALPFRAYNRIFNDWYRDQDLQTPLVVSTGSGVDTTTSTTLVNGCWEKDYFTSARPWEQKGPTVSIPLTGNAPILGIGVPQSDSSFPVSNAAVRETTTGATTFPFARSVNPSVSSGELYIEGVAAAGGSNPSIFANLTGITAVTMNDLRLSLGLQRYEEARARYGSRYPEYLLYLGVRPGDARLQRPEYIGGGKSIIQFSEIMQTAPTTDGDDTEGVGNLKGHGIGFGKSRRFRRFFDEHGYVITLLVVRPKTMYIDGLNKMWNRRTKEDHWQKELEHVGQQEVLNKEVYFAGASPDGVFGYQDRYDDYRRIESRVAGEFRTTLDFWHMARKFSSAPALNASFVSSNPTNRIYSVTDDAVDKLWITANHSIQARRLVSQTGTSFIY